MERCGQQVLCIRAINRRAVIYHALSCQSISTGVSRYISSLIRRGMPHFTQVIRFAFVRSPTTRRRLECGSLGRRAGRPSSAAAAALGAVAARSGRDRTMMNWCPSPDLHQSISDLTHDSICQRQSRPAAGRSDCISWPWLIWTRTAPNERVSLCLSL